MIMIKNKLMQEGKVKQAKRIFLMPSTYTAMVKLISALKKIGVNPNTDDRVIICCDDRSWRKNVSKEYKSNRESMRERAKFIDWKKEFKMHKDLLNRIRIGTSFFVIRVRDCEADDLISEAVRFYKDKFCLIVSPDGDFHQLITYDNVRVFSPHPKAKIPYRILDLDREKEKKKAYKSLMKKIEKEVSDNLVTEISNEREYDERRKLVSLLELPGFISQRITETLRKIDNVEKGDSDLSLFSPSIRKRFMDIYKEDNIITYKECREKLERKNRKKVKEVKKK